jgi:hypothetical protein
VRGLATSYEGLSSIKCKWVASFGDPSEGPTKPTWPPGLLPLVGVDKWQHSAVLSLRKILEDQNPHMWVDGGAGQLVLREIGSSILHLQICKPGKINENSMQISANLHSS